MISNLPSTVTGSRTLDQILFFGILALMVLATPLLLVYYRSPFCKIVVVAITSEGERLPRKTPKPLKGIRPGIQGAERLIRDFARTPAALELAPPDGRLEWSVHFSKSLTDTIQSTRLKGVRIVATGDNR